MSYCYLPIYFSHSIGIFSFIQKRERYRICFGRSGIHGWGLFARRRIQEGDMVLHRLGSSLCACVTNVKSLFYISYFPCNAYRFCRHFSWLMHLSFLFSRRHSFFKCCTRLEFLCHTLIWISLASIMMFNTVTHISRFSSIVVSRWGVVLQI